MPRAFGYTRVSTTAQQESGLSLEEQKRQIIEFCRKQDFDLGPNNERIGEEAESAYKTEFADRPLGKLFLKNMVRGDVLVIAKTDRAFRNMMDALSTAKLLKNRGIELRILDIPYCNQESFNDLLLMLLSWIAKFESDRRSERLRDMYRSLRLRGAPVGTTDCGPFGFRWMGSRKYGTAKLVYCPEERVQMKLVYELHTEHELGFGQIEGWLVRHKIMPYDRRAQWRKQRRAVPGTHGVPTYFHRAQHIPPMIRIESELRYFESQGLSETEAAEAWLKHYREGTLPDDETILAKLAEANGAKANTKGEQVCQATTA